MPSLKEVIARLETLAPVHLAESWDHVGLMVGSRQQEVKKVLCALDVNEEVIEEAIEGGYECIVSHHPFLFSALSAIDLDSPKGQLISKLIKHDISVYSMHTNYDIAPGGLNDYLCQCIGLEQIELLDETGEVSFSKIVVYVPNTHLEVVRNKIIEVNPCCIGNYKGCTFSGSGEGTFMPLEGSTPFIGKMDVLEKVAETKLEFIAYEKDVTFLLEQIKAVHPYEEVAFDVYALSHIKESVGIGRVGKLQKPMLFEDLVKHLKQVFKVDYVRVTEVPTKPIQKVALCSGSGSSYIKVAAKKADVYITGDMQFHKGQEAKALGLPVIDVGHYASENIAMTHISEYLKQNFKELVVNCSKVNGETLLIK